MVIGVSHLVTPLVTHLREDICVLSGEDICVLSDRVLLALSWVLVLGCSRLVIHVLWSCYSQPVESDAVHAKPMSGAVPSACRLH